MMRNLAIGLLGYLLCVLIGPLWRITPFEVVTPQIALVVAAYLGITARTGLAGATATAAFVGYAADLLGGSPIGLYAFVAGTVCVLARIITLRLIVRGGVFVLGLCGSLTLLGSLLAIALCAYHGAQRGAFFDELLVAIGSAIVTGLLAAPIFRFCRMVDARFARTEREREGLREGLLN
jgi:hypothetical protein